MYFDNFLCVIYLKYTNHSGILPWNYLNNLEMIEKIHQHSIYITDMYKKLLYSLYISKLFAITLFSCKKMEKPLLTCMFNTKHEYWNTGCFCYINNCLHPIIVDIPSPQTELFPPNCFSWFGTLILFSRWHLGVF